MEAPPPTPSLPAMFSESDVLDAQTIDAVARTLFDAINEHGYYTTMEWFMELTRIDLGRFMREMVDIWVYRAALSSQMRMRICPTSPFVILTDTLRNIMSSPDTDINVVRQVVLYAMHNLVLSGVTVEDRALGTIYVLQALTLVSAGAREELPWLYESVA